MTNTKCVLIIDESLPLGVIANTAAVISASIGKLHPEIIGENLTDAKDRVHHGITTMALPILKGNPTLLKTLREKLFEYNSELTVIDLINATRTTQSYQEYAAALKDKPDTQIQYQGLGIIGNKKLVTKLTGDLGLLR
jgi:hypothetical protein